MMFVRIVYFLTIITFASNLIYSQRLLKISVDRNGAEATLSYLSRNSTLFVSGKEIASLLSANIYYNQEAAKLEIKFENYTIKFTAKNQFVIITKRSDNTQNIFQVPISTLLINNDVFFPLLYCLNYLSWVYEYELEFDERAKNLSITNKPYTPNMMFVQKDEKSDLKPVESKTKIEEVRPASRYDIYGISIDEKSNGTLVRIKTSRKLNIPRHSINNNTLYVFFPGISIDPALTSGLKYYGLVKQVKRVPVSSRNYQLEFLLADGFSTSEAFQDVESTDLMITIHNKLFTAQNFDNKEIKTKWEFDCIVIDAGHGGKDPGAIGVTGVREKDVNLAIALKLGRLFEKEMPGIKVVYTRQTDDFVELYKRGKIANEAGGKLFVSIHCNSTVKKDIAHRGFEVYLLRPGRTQEAIEIAEFENSVIKLEENPQRYQQLTDENFILVSMAHSQYMRYSEQFSDLLNQDWKKNVQIPSLGIKQAGFYVLVGASMPSVLIETGFLSNRKDEALLASTSGQNEIARSIFNSIKKYKQFYDRELEKVN
ncbi:MAG: N-acetylmuramoyl-L-alanine amidase [Ignavibacteria bacterium]|nr:N-acetylmuramoyl-L-alanine amidase [Ignavibacteria bacterium]